MTQKEENDHRQATRQLPRGLRGLSTHITFSRNRASIWDHFSTLIWCFSFNYSSIFSNMNKTELFRGYKTVVILPHSSLRRQHPEVSAVGGTCTGDRPANRRHNWIKNPVVFSPPVLASGPFRWAPEMQRMRGRSSCCRRCWQFNPAPLGECWWRLFKWWRGVFVCACVYWKHW